MKVFNHKEDDFYNRFLSEKEGAGETAEKYRKEMDRMLEQNEKRLKREKWITGSMWIYLVILCTAMLLLGGFAENMETRIWFGVLACFWFLFGVAFLMRYFINRTRFELLKELKEIQLQIMELNQKKS